MIDFNGYIDVSSSPLERELGIVRRKNNRPNSMTLIGDYENVLYVNGTSVLCWLNHEYSTIPHHWHPSVEIIMPFENKYYVKLSNENYILEEGDILVIPPGEVHELSAISEGYRMILVFDPTVISSIKEFSGMWSSFLIPTLVNAKNAPETYDNIKDTMLEIFVEYMKDAAHWELLTYTLLIKLFILIDRNKFVSKEIFADISENKQMVYTRRINAVFEFVNERYMDEITLEEAAKVAGFSKFHFIRLFKMFTNTSFQQYLNIRRIRAAETLLLDPNAHVTQIAMTTGFSSISTFNRVFKSIKNCTPTEFKELARNERGINF